MLKRIEEKLEVFNYFLLLLIITIFSLMVFVKVYSFNKYKILNKYDSLVSELKNNEETLNLKLSALVSPARLENIYSELKGTYFANSDVLYINQIKTLNNLLVYYYSKNKGINSTKIMVSKK